MAARAATGWWTLTAAGRSSTAGRRGWTGRGLPAAGPLIGRLRKNQLRREQQQGRGNQETTFHEKSPYAPVKIRRVPGL
jgi:hypothetical protein